MSAYIDILINPTGFLIQKGVEVAIKKVQDIRDTGSLSELEEAAKKEEVYSQISIAQAKVAQELAIAQRINNAEEVEIEEYYEGEGSGNVGIQGNATTKTANLGISGQGRRVTKRVYRFKGKNSEVEEFLEE